MQLHLHNPSIDVGNMDLVSTLKLNTDEKTFRKTLDKNVSLYNCCIMRGTNFCSVTLACDSIQYLKKKYSDVFSPIDINA